MEANVSRQRIFELAAQKLRAEFEEIRSVPHRGLKGQEREHILRKFLNDHLPKRFAAGSGFIIDKFDHVSPQTDVVIYDQLYCPVYRADDHAAIYPSTNVAAVVDVKSTLDKTSLEDAAGKIAKVKGLRKLVSEEDAQARAPVQFETMGIVFAFESGATLQTLLDHYRNTIVSKGVLGPHIDLIVILDVGMLHLVTNPPSEDGWAPIFFFGPGGADAEGFHIGAGGIELGRNTLDAFLRMLLPHLDLFKGRVDHPGFDWRAMSTTKGLGMVSYITSITTETDPQKREQKLAKYREEARQKLQRATQPQTAA